MPTDSYVFVLPNTATELGRTQEVAWFHLRSFKQYLSKQVGYNQMPFTAWKQKKTGTETEKKNIYYDFMRFGGSNAI